MISLRSKPDDRLADIRGPGYRPSSPAKGGLSHNSARSGEFQRNRHLPGAKGWNSPPHESAVVCVELSPGGPAEFRRSADPPSGRLCGEGARFREIPPDLPKFREIATYLGWKGGIWNPVNLWSAV